MPRPVKPPPPPSREGVGPSCVGVPAGHWPRVAEFLAQRLPVLPLAGWQARLDRGEVLDAQGRPLSPDSACLGPTRLWYYRHLVQEEEVPFEEQLVHEDKHLLVVDKPHFLPVTPGGRFVQQSLLVRLRRRLGLEGLVPAHRLDRDTAGLVLFTKHAAARDPYQALFRERRVDKHYEAIAPLAEGQPLPAVYRSRLEERPGEAFMQMHEVPGEPNAETRLQLLEVRGALARYALQPLTGRKHQLRAHLAALGRPIVNDRLYPDLLPQELQPDYQRPLKLLARRLAFTDPLSGEARSFSSGLSLDF